MLNGDGLRVVLWVAGCNHCCKECQNPITWDPDGGLLFDESAKQEIFEQLEKPYISGITFSGGDPMHPVNRADVRELMSEIREKYPTKTIWMYTGDSWEDICDLPVMQYVDVVWLINADDAASGSSRTQELVYRDGIYYQIWEQESTKFPMNSIFNHEPKKTSTGEPEQTFRNYLFMNLSRGTGFIELYIKTQKISACLHSLCSVSSCPPRQTAF